MSIITVTLNPAIDQTITIDQLTVGAVHRAESVHYNAGGKGIMVASCLAEWGLTELSATGFLGEDNAGIFIKALDEKGIKNQFIKVPGSNRTNIKIVDKKDTTDINLPGIKGSQSALGEVIQKVQADYGLVVISGSLPEKLDKDTYQAMIQQIPPKNRVILDASGDALIHALKGKRVPYCVKPNELELSQWAGKSLTTDTEILGEAVKLLDLGIQIVVISMGSSGAYFLSKEGVFKAYLSAPKIVTTVGAGDAMVAGISAAIKEGGNLERIARLGTAFSVSTLGFIGPHLDEKSIVEDLASRVQIEKREGIL